MTKPEPPSGVSVVEFCIGAWLNKQNVIVTEIIVSSNLAKLENICFGRKGTNVFDLIQHHFLASGKQDLRPQQLCFSRCQTGKHLRQQNCFFFSSLAERHSFKNVLFYFT